MAKKKKKTAKKKASAKRPAKKSAKKSPKKKSAPKKAPVKKTAAKSSPRASSVDGVLKKYEKERSAQESQLTTLRKKIDDLEAKSRAFQEQIAKLTTQEDVTKDAIMQLDSRRDEEVGQLLSKLGVQLGGGGSVVADELAGSDYDDEPYDGDDSGDAPESADNDEPDSSDEAELESGEESEAEKEETE